jgi:hypothetical protein
MYTCLPTGNEKLPYFTEKSYFIKKYVRCFVRNKGALCFLSKRKRYILLKFYSEPTDR